MKFKNEQFGVRFVEREPGDPHICVQLMDEDDGQWFDIGQAFSSHWLGDLIEVLKAAKVHMERTYRKDPSGSGYIFVKKNK